MKKFLAWMLALAMMLSLAACGGSGSEDAAPEGGDDAASGGKVVRIGVFEPATGDSGPGGKQEMLGMQYANKETPTCLLYTSGRGARRELLSLFPPRDAALR